MNSPHKLIISLILAIAISISLVYAAPVNVQQQAKERIEQLSKLIKVAEAEGINTLKERTALRTAEIFMEYAAWDEVNIATNTKHFAKVARYKKEAAEYAALLPDFEREEIVKMMDSSIIELSRVISGEIIRRESPQIDWSQITIEADQVLYEGKPVFLTDWTWKPNTPAYTEYFGAMDGTLISPMIVTEDFGITERAESELKTKESGEAGMIFIGHSSMPEWAKMQDPTLSDGPGIKYVMYDINNPLGHKVDKAMIAGSVPYMAGKNYTKLGYMLCNEPHWISTKGSYAAGALSDRAIEDFKLWLRGKHGSIEVLNSIWNTSYTDFSQITIAENMVEAHQIGTPLYYDFVTYNMARVSRWFHMLDDEVKKADPEAKTHIKIMPDMWSDNPKDNGLDLEELTRMSDIIGNDASTAAHLTWGAKQWWEVNYSFNWRELCMGYDFMKSVSPDKIIFNSEGHLLTTNKYRNLHETPQYARMNYWLAHIHGLNVIRSWYWARKEDGSSRGSDTSTGYAGSNNHQPRIVNEVHATTIDLNSVATEITEFQRQRKSIRLFYSFSAAINNATQMDDLFEVYEMLYFEGSPIGFATQGIIENNPHDQWDAIIVARTKSAKRSEVEVLQDYLDGGGTVIIDSESLKVDEYGMPLDVALKASHGKLIEIDAWSEAKAEFANQLLISGNLPQLTVTEINEALHKGVMWRVISSDKTNTFILSMVNMGCGTANIEIQHRDTDTHQISAVTNYLTGEKLKSTIEMNLHQTLLLEIKITEIEQN
ncbi:MAG: beta-galactosidase [Rikenellaceae bacterium]